MNDPDRVYESEDGDTKRWSQFCYAAWKEGAKQDSVPSGLY